MQHQERRSDLALSLVIPVYNEMENVKPLVEEIWQCFAGRSDYETIFIDDGSTDSTLKRLIDLRETGPGPVRIIRHRSNYGKSAALRSGFKAANAPWVVTLDGDCQNDPADIQRLWDMANNPNQPSNLQLVCGYRRNRQDTWLKRRSSTVANAIRGRLLNDCTPDSACGLKLINREAFLALPDFENMHRFLPALIQQTGATVASVEVNDRPRTRGRSKYGLHNRLWVGIVDLLGVMWLQRRRKNPVIDKID